MSHVSLTDRARANAAAALGVSLAEYVRRLGAYAAADTGDRHNARARQVLAGDPSLVTSDHVLVEVWLLLRHRLHRAAAEQFWAPLRAGPVVDLVNEGRAALRNG